MREMAEAGAYAQLRSWLARADLAALARDWSGLDAMHKLIAFKLMNAAQALDFYRRLPAAEKYFLFCGFSLNAIAPILEDAPASVRRLFVQLPAKFQAFMLRELALSYVQA